MKHDNDMTVDRICALKDKLVGMVEHELDANAAEVDAHELGEVVDMIKDLAEAEKYVREAEYHQSVTDAMEDYSDGRMGYNPNRDSRGRYTSGSMRRRGYPERPGDDTAAWGDREPPHMTDGMGYRPGKPYARMMDDDMGDGEERHGRAFDRYRRDKRHYTQTHSEQDKQAMRDHANEHMAETMATIREIWDDADPELRKRMKADLTKLTAEMG